MHSLLHQRCMQDSQKGSYPSMQKSSEKPPRRSPMSPAKPLAEQSVAANPAAEPQNLPQPPPSSSVAGIKRPAASSPPQELPPSKKATFGSVTVDIPFWETTQRPQKIAAELHAIGNSKSLDNTRPLELEAQQVCVMYFAQK